MTTHKIFVDNIKCNGCIQSIKNALQKIKGVSAINIFKEEDKICVSGIAIDRDEIIKKLASMGYPEKGHNNIFKKAKSFVSCTVGRLS